MLPDEAVHQSLELHPRGFLHVHHMAGLGEGIVALGVLGHRILVDGDKAGIQAAGGGGCFQVQLLEELAVGEVQFGQVSAPMPV